MENTELTLTPELASRLAKVALHGVAQEHPNVLERFANPSSAQPHQFHPAFYGCYDWHSAVHSHWMLLRLLKSVPDLPEAPQIRVVLDSHLTAENLQTEVFNFGSSPYTGLLQAPAHPHALYSLPGQPAFEKPYGWAWVLQLAAELHDWQDPQGQLWFSNIQLLAQRMVALFTQLLEKPSPELLPRREGLHTNTAFALGLALDYARQCDQPDLEKLIMARGLDFYQSDKAAPAHEEPGPTDFLSPSLIEADFMSRVLPPQDFATWFNEFLPAIEPNLLKPVFVSDHDDPYICHLDGLNLSRTWCFYRIAHSLPEDLPIRATLLEAAHDHRQEGLAHIFEGNFKSTGHWLCTFAVYLLTFC